MPLIGRLDSSHEVSGASVGVPDAHSGEAVVLFVVPKDPALSEGQCNRLVQPALRGERSAE
jgi:hypothetical protein